MYLNPYPLAQGPAESSHAPLVPVLEAFATTNPGLYQMMITVVGGLLVLGVIALLPPGRTGLVWACKALGRLMAFLWHAVAKFLLDRWERLRTPLEERGTFDEERNDWERERLRMESELSESRRIAERRRQEINNNAQEFQRYRKNCESSHAVGGSGAGPQKPDAEWRAKADLRIECENSRGLLGMGPWVLKNWGPCAAYKIYVTTTDPDSSLEEEHREHLNPKESMTLFRSSPRRHSGLYLADVPRIRVTYEDAGGKNHEDFLEMPTESFSSSLSSKKPSKR